MNYLDIHPTERLRVSLTLPASKSISNRALLINALSHSEDAPQNVSDCDDTRVMVAALRNMPDVIDIGAAGTAMRFLTAYLSVTPGVHTITGTERMRHRPIGILVDALRRLGASVDYKGEAGFPPLRIVGNPQLRGGELELAGDVSSQYISALLMIAPTLSEGLRLRLTGNIVSRPYLDMTVAMMREFCARVEWEGEDMLRVDPVPYQPRTYTIENDWSAASYWYEMVALSLDAQAEVILPGLHLDSLQGDWRVSEIFAELGVATECFRLPDGTEAVRLSKREVKTDRLSLDMTRQPDLAQTMAVTAAMLDIPFTLSGLRTLRIKETDRIAALCNELQHLGLDIEDKGGDSIEWTGIRDRATRHPVISTYEDHRMAMAFAPLALKAPVCINHPEVVRKSYPHFWSDMRCAGFRVESK